MPLQQVDTAAVTVWRWESALVALIAALASAVPLAPMSPIAATVAALAIAPSDVNTVYASTQDGRLWVTHDDGVIWSELDSGLSGIVLDLRIDPDDPNHVFAVTSNQVWHLPPSGPPWQQITGNIPGNLSLYTVFVAWEPTVPALFVGTDRGIYRSFDLGSTWIKSERGLPNTRVNDLQGEIRAGRL